MSLTLNATLAVADTSPHGGQAPVPLPRLRAVLAHITRSLLVACFHPGPAVLRVSGDDQPVGRIDRGARLVLQRQRMADGDQAPAVRPARADHGRADRSD